MRPTTLTLLSILVLVLIAGWWFQTFERVATERFVGFSGEARFNQFYAAERLLADRGIDSDGRPSLTPTTWLPANTDTLVTYLQTTIDVSNETSALLAWVESGGHLLVIPGDELSASGRFMSTLGLEFVAINPRPYDSETEADTTPPDGVPVIDESFHRIRFIGDEPPSQVLEDELGALVARITFGNGVVTVVASRSAFSNSSLSNLDNAQVLLDLVDGPLRPGKVWFVYGAEFDSLLGQILSAFPLAVAAAVACFLLWLLSILPRFGPRIAEEEPVRRSLAEHIRAAGLFEWRTSGGQKLIASARAALLHEAEIRYPGLGRLAPAKQAQKFAAITGLHADHVLDALVGVDRKQGREFTSRIEVLQQIRNRL